MTESDSDFEMLEKRLSDLNPDELILVGLVHFTSEFYYAELSRAN